jgi:hypothetical protein
MLSNCGEKPCTPQQVWEKFRENIDIKDRKFHLKSYTNCFVGSEAGLSKII